MYTDGLLERSDDAAEQSERLRSVAARLQHLPAGGLGDQLVADMLGGHSISDDVCVLVIRRAAAHGPARPVSVGGEG
jgi:serine phosphatase RsbU (regulator of sigma subunit)